MRGEAGGKDGRSAEDNDVRVTTTTTTTCIAEPVRYLVSAQSCALEEKPCSAIYLYLTPHHA